jgi:rubrerythrin
VASASFIEITSDLYTYNLIEYFRDDSEIVEWLENVWQKEELQHGDALRRYVRTAWPDFDWDAAYRDFLAAYTPLCTVDQLARTRALEMAARCVVETGTAAFYRMLSEQSREPVLKQLAARISADEVRHYKHFYSLFPSLSGARAAEPSRGAADTLEPGVGDRGRGCIPCLQVRLSRAQPGTEFQRERLHGLRRRHFQARKAPLSAWNGRQDAAETSRPQSRGRARGAASRHVGDPLHLHAADRQSHTVNAGIRSWHVRQTPAVTGVAD